MAMDLGGVPAIGGGYMPSSFTLSEFIGWNDEDKADKQNRHRGYIEFMSADGVNKDGSGTPAGCTHRYYIAFPIGYQGGVVSDGQKKIAAGNFVAILKSAGVDTSRLSFRDDKIENWMEDFKKALGKRRIPINYNAADPARGKQYPETGFISMAQYNANVASLKGGSVKTEEKASTSTGGGIKLDGLELDAGGDALDKV